MSEQRNDSLTIGSFLKQVKRQVILDDKETYKLLGVKWYGQGMFLREEKTGKEIKADKLFRVHTGDFVYNRLFAWKSSFAIVEKDLDGCLVSNEFPTFEYDLEKIDPYFLLNYVLQPSYIDYVNRKSGGMSSVSRKRFKEEEFTQSDFPDYSIEEQRLISNRIRNYKNLLGELSSTFQEQTNYILLLRQSILQEAIEGKLTAEWRKNNPIRKGDPEYDARRLLEKIKEEKKRMIAEGKIKKQKPLAPIQPEEVPFELPEGWVWTWLGELIELISGQHIEATDCNSAGIGSPYLTGPADFGEKHPIITKWTKKPKVFAQKNDLLITVKGSGVGKTNICNLEAVVISRQLMAIRSNILNRNLVRLFILSMKQSLQDSKDGLIPGITRNHILDSIFPLPPLAEQHAIVERVDRLLGMVDELEKQVDERKDCAEELLQAVLREAFGGR